MDDFVHACTRLTYCQPVEDICKTNLVRLMKRIDCKLSTKSISVCLTVSPQERAEMNQYIETVVSKASQVGQFGLCGTYAAVVAVDTVTNTVTNIVTNAVKK